MAWWDVCNNGTTCFPWNPSGTGDPATGGGKRNDYSIPLPVGTNVTSPVSGIVLDNHTSGGGYYSAYGRQDWGGEVDILTYLPQYGGLVVVNLLHFDTVRARPFDRVRAGDVLGTSGGQTSGGNWPSSPRDSSGPHMGVGVHGVQSWNDMRNPQQLLDPLWAGHDQSAMPTMSQLQAAGLGALPQGQPIQGSGSIQVTPGNGTPSAQAAANAAADDPCSKFNGLDPRNWICRLQQQFGVLFAWLSDPLRIGKLALGALLVIGGFVLFALPSGLEVAGAATGQPELALAGRTLRSPKRGVRAASVHAAHVHRARTQANQRQAARAATSGASAAKRGGKSKPTSAPPAKEEVAPHAS